MSDSGIQGDGFEGVLQTEAPLCDGTLLVTYRGADRRVWHRAPSEFDDGRFVSLGRDDAAGLGRFRHLKRGSDYDVLIRGGILRTDAPVSDGAVLVTVREGEVWIHRPV